MKTNKPQATSQGVAYVLDHIASKYPTYKYGSYVLSENTVIKGAWISFQARKHGFSQPILPF